MQISKYAYNLHSRVAQFRLNFTLM